MRSWAVVALLLAGCAGPGAGQDIAGDPEVGWPGVTDPDGDALSLPESGTTDGTALGGNTTVPGNATTENGTAPAGNQTTTGNATTENGAVPPGNETAPGNGTDGNGTDPPGPGGGPEAPPEEPESPPEDPGTRLLEVSVFDNALGTLRAPRNLEVEMVGFGSWVPDLPRYGSAGPQPMGQHEVGVWLEDGLVVYPDGRSRSACAVDIRMTAAMEDESHESLTVVEVWDDEVWIYGMAVPGYPDWDTPFVCAR